MCAARKKVKEPNTIMPLGTGYESLTEMHPEVDEASVLKPHSYLIENVDGYNFVVHRQLKEGEEEEFEGRIIYEHKGNKYLFCVVNCPSHEEAVLAIQSYWQASRQIEAHRRKHEGNQ